MNTQSEMITVPEMTVDDSVWIKAQPDVVFKALSDGNELVHWFPDGEAETVPEIGGSVIMKWKDGSTLKTSFLNFIENKVLSYGFYGGDKEPVTFRLEPENGGTRVDLEHLIPAGSPLDMVVGVSQNWGHLMEGLKCWVERQWDIRESQAE